MKKLDKEIIQVLKSNFYLSDIIDNYGFDIKFSKPACIDKNKNLYLVVMDIINDLEYNASLILNINTENYDEKLKDVNKYEIDDMGLIINIVTGGGGNVVELNETEIWKELFFSMI